MTLDKLISLDRIVPEMEAVEHWPAITELVDHLIAVGAFPAGSRESILEALRAREDQCSTGIGGGKAIPHAYSDAVDEVVTVFGRSREGIEFGAIDNAPVFFIVLLIVPKEQYTLHLKTLAAIARGLSSAEIYRRLSEAAGSREILDVFALAESSP